MFKIRQLAAGLAVSFGLAGAAQPLMAQSVTDFLKDNKGEKTNGADNVKGETKSKEYDNDALCNHLQGDFKGVIPIGEGEKRYFSVQGLNYTLRSNKQDVRWNVEFGMVMRGEKQLVRMYFSCQTMPENVNIARLKGFMSWSGDHTASTAFFKTISNGKTDQLYIVADYHLDAVKNTDWRKEVDKLFMMADDTLYLWSGDLSKPIGQKETKNETPKEKVSINGLWDGKVTIDDEEVGQYSMQFMDGVIVASRARKGSDSVSMLTGTYILEGTKLTIEYKDVEKPEVYDVKLDGKTLTLSSKKGDKTLSVKLKKGQ
jgi:hypothetical protein